MPPRQRDPDLYTKTRLRIDRAIVNQVAINTLRLNQIRMALFVSNDCITHLFVIRLT